MASLNEYGSFLENLRKDTNMSQSEVANKAHISRATISRLENGEIYPSLETLMALSEVYKIDLIKLLSEYNLFQNADIKELVRKIEKNLSDRDTSSLGKDVVKLELLIEKEGLEKDSLITQYHHIIEGIYHRVNKEYEEAEDDFIHAIQVRNPNFTISSYKDFNYSQIELRALMNIASLAYIQGNESFYQEMLLFSYDKSHIVDNTYFMIATNVAIMYLRVYEHEDSLRVCNEAIAKAEELESYGSLPLLYYQKSLVEFQSGDQEAYEKSIRNTIHLCETQGKHKLKEEILKTLQSCAIPLPENL